MSKVKTFRMTVKCDRDWEYENAFVAIRQWTITSQDTGDSVDGVENYVEDNAIEGIAYRGNFWKSVQDQIDGKRSRPLINADSIENPELEDDLLKVDMGHLQSIQVMNSSMPREDKKWRLIELDIERRAV